MKCYTKLGKNKTSGSAKSKIRRDTETESGREGGREERGNGESDRD